MKRFPICDRCGDPAIFACVYSDDLVHFHTQTRCKEHYDREANAAYANVHYLRGISLDALVENLYAPAYARPGQGATDG